MMFRMMAPFYDMFIRSAGVDNSGMIPVWLAPVKGMEILDLGGGTGMNAETLCRSGAKVTLADESDSMLKKAAAKKMPVNLVHAKAESLPLPECLFDIVLISDAWHHFKDQAGAAGEAARVLRPGGRLYIVDFDPGVKITKTIAFFEKLLAEPADFTPPGELIKVLRQAGIEGACRDLKYGQYIYEGRKV